MGNCCSHKLTSNNIYEKFIIDVIYNLKIRKYTFDKIEEFYSEIASKEIIQDKAIFKEVTYLSENDYYRILKKKFVENDLEKNPYCIIQINIFPSYNDFLGEDPEFLFKYKTFPFISRNESSKVFKQIQNLISIKNMNSSQLTFNDFFAFLKDYINDCLFEIPKKITSSLEFIIKIYNLNLVNLQENETKEFGNIGRRDLENFLIRNKNIFINDDNFEEAFGLGEYKIDKNFLDNLVKYLNSIQNINKLEAIYSELERKMQEILFEENEFIKISELNELPIQNSNFQIFYNELPWLWDAIDLRIYYVITKTNLS